MSAAPPIIVNLSRQSIKSVIGRAGSNRHQFAGEHPGSNICETYAISRASDNSSNKLQRLTLWNWLQWNPFSYPPKINVGNIFGKKFGDRCTSINRGSDQPSVRLDKWERFRFDLRTLVNGRRNIWSLCSTLIFRTAGNLGRIWNPIFTFCSLAFMYLLSKQFPFFYLIYRTLQKNPNFIVK